MMMMTTKKEERREKEEGEKVWTGKGKPQRGRTEREKIANKSN